MTLAILTLISAISSHSVLQNIQKNGYADNLIDAFKDHEVECVSGAGSGAMRNYFLDGTGGNAYTSKSLFSEYDKYGNLTGGGGLISDQGYVMKGGLNRILGASLESGVSLEDAMLKDRMRNFKVVTASYGTGAYDASLGNLYGKRIAGYKDSRVDENLLEYSNPDIVKNIRCNFPSNGFGHVYCTDNRIIGEHYDLSHRKGPYRVNAHFESPSKVQEPPNCLSYHPNAHKDLLMAKRVGFTDNDLLQSKMHKACVTSDCKMKYPAYRKGVARFIAPADEFHEV
ncbi:uncharacterized protein VICG_01626 [Vittaforma corneae ATCC 50505]|uniref:Uncharacterized protein n=1 Tax=Vittaforma corneae (strain ATCC 50505) TaxID=993615 RepID=L2GLK4_VITCO|nr:uncharacterized protein VICG_01626 [Vittaforma corneae ATCC 50505]ELA41385.1 hypothetical protein VICG_01626 [Vittaforma corneae ATCC 50505]